MSMTDGQSGQYRHGDEEGQGWEVRPGMTVQGTDGLEIGHVSQVHANGGTSWLSVQAAANSRSSFR